MSSAVETHLNLKYRSIALEGTIVLVLRISYFYNQTKDAKLVIIQNRNTLIVHQDQYREPQFSLSNH